ncbi:DNase I-like protein [Dioscorea alata]|uniref:DNase I-like protein n=1 Tax=Dioscorea alata TaxID=55571 RepID=A0ACB7WPF5_DIOAL|nr:DNase I-like protein [Dioscorea alata]
MGYLWRLQCHFTLDDKVYGFSNLGDLHLANIFLQDLGLREPPLVGRRFTWTNAQVDPVWVKLDHFIVNIAWADHFPRMIQSFLPILESNYVPILLEVGIHLSSPRPFRFEWIWESVRGLGT